MFARKKLLGGLIGLFAAGALLAPVAAAPVPASVTVAADEVVDTIYPDRCSIDINLSWIPAELTGPAVNVRLLESDDGGSTWASAGMHVRTDNNGGDYFRRYFAPSTHAAFQVQITKGPKHIIASGASAIVVCNP